MTVSPLETLIAQATQPGPDQEEAAGTLGLLLEVSRTRRPAGKNSDLVALLGPELSTTRLSKVEIGQVIAALSTAVMSEPQTMTAPLWALGKSADPRIIPALIHALDEALQKPGKELVASQAFQGLKLFETPESLDAVQRAAEHGDEELKAQASNYLSLFDDT